MSRATPRPPAVVRLVAGREVRERVRSRAWQVTTAVLVLLAAAAAVVPALLDPPDDVPTVEVAVTGLSDPTVAALAALGPAAGADLVVSTVADPAAAEAAVRGDAVDVGVTPEAVLVGGAADGGAVSRVVAAAAQLVGLQTTLEEAGLAPEAAASALAAPPLPVRAVERPDDPSGGDVLLATVGAAALYAALVFYGQWIANGVNEEKSSRVIEVLLSAVRPSHLLVGKVVGIGLLGLTQLALVAVVGLAAATAAGTDLPSGSVADVVSFVAWFLLGFAFYAFVFAAAGALTQRQEDAQQAAMPVYLFLVVAYVGAITAASAPDAAPAVVLSWLPPTAPVVMPVRAAVGAAGAVEVAAAMALTVVGTVAMAAVGARIYRGAILRFGPRVRLRQAWRGARG